MKILQLCKKFPYPLKDGEAIAVTHLTRALRDVGCEITLLSMNTTKHYTHLSELPAHFDHYKEIHSVVLDNQIKPWEAFKNLFSKKSFHIERFQSPDFRCKLEDLLRANKFDIVQLESLYLTPYIDTIRQHSDAKVVMRSHNVEHEIWEGVSRNTKMKPKKWYLSYLTRKLKNFEIETLNQYDHLLAMTDHDLDEFKRLGYKNGATITPIGIELSDYPISEEDNASGISIGFIGSLDWMPNLEGLNWFLEKVWPDVANTYPGLQFHIAGSNAPQSIPLAEQDGVVFHGEVPDSVAFVNQHQIMVVPLWSGSGMRVKILEGMALKKVIISTSLGKEGIKAEEGKEILCADSAVQFIQAISNLLSAQERILNIGDAAYQFVSRKFDNKSIAKGLLNTYQALLNKELVH